MTDKKKMPNKIAAWRFLPEKADEWIHGGWSEDHDHKTTEYTPTSSVAAQLKAADELARRAEAVFRSEYHNTKHIEGAKAYFDASMDALIAYRKAKEPGQ